MSKLEEFQARKEAITKDADKNLREMNEIISNCAQLLGYNSIEEFNAKHSERV